MSYDIVKGIKTVDGKVLIKSASNNVYPRYYDEHESKSLTKILAEQGKEALELVIFREFENGNFKGSISKYQRALKVLRNSPEYAAFNWRLGHGKVYEEISKRRETADFDELLKKALKTRLPKDKFILVKDYLGRPVYCRKLARGVLRWTTEKENAKVFRYAAEVEQIKGWFTGADSWTTEQVK